MSIGFGVGEIPTVMGFQGNPAPPVTTAAVGWWAHPTSACPIAYTVALDFAFPGSTQWNTYTQAAAQAFTNANQRLYLKIGGNLTSGQATAIAQECVAGGQQNAWISPGWEGNQDTFFPLWNQNAYTAAQYIAQWGVITTAMSAVTGANFKYIWDQNPNGSNAAGRTWFDNWPGGSWQVDAHAIDIYDEFGSVANASTLIQQQLTFAESKNKPFMFGEWGINTNLSASEGAAYVNMISGYTHGSYSVPIWAQVYFSDSSGSPPSQLSSSSAATAAYVADFP